LQEEDGSGHAGIARVRRWLSAFWQDPDWSLLPMVAYCLLSLVTGVNFSVGAGPLPAISGWVATLFFAWRTAVGGRFSRLLLLLVSWTAFIFAVVSVRNNSSVRDLAALLASAAQIALLLSPGIFEASRPVDHFGRYSLWRTRSPGWLVATLAVGSALGLAGIAICVTVVSGHNKAGIFHGGGGVATIVCAVLFLGSFAGLTLPLSNSLPRTTLAGGRADPLTSPD
jgi:hypothetical protein